MMTVLELINAIENSRGSYDDPIEIVRPVVGRTVERYTVVDVEYDATGGPDDDGVLRIVISREG
jgi:hypothetical protein